MLKVIKQCVIWFDWRLVVGGLAVIVGLALCDKLPTLGIFAGVTPLLLIAACLVPCLLPLMLFRGTSRGHRTKEPGPENKQEEYTSQG
jgi:hypothetical protein